MNSTSTTNGMRTANGVTADIGDGERVSKRRRRAGLVLTCLVTAFFLLDAAGKLAGAEVAISATVALGWPSSSVFFLGLLLLVGAVLHMLPRTSVLGAIYLTGYLGGAIAAHYRIGSPLFSHVLFGVYVAAIMWAGVFLRYPAVLSVIAAPTGKR